MINVAIVCLFLIHISPLRRSFNISFPFLMSAILFLVLNMLFLSLWALPVLLNDIFCLFQDQRVNTRQFMQVTLLIAAVEALFILRLVLNIWDIKTLFWAVLLNQSLMNQALSSRFENHSEHVVVSERTTPCWERTALVCTAFLMKLSVLHFTLSWMQVLLSLSRK